MGQHWENPHYGGLVKIYKENNYKNMMKNHDCRIEKNILLVMGKLTLNVCLKQPLQIIPK